MRTYHLLWVAIVSFGLLLSGCAGSSSNKAVIKNKAEVSKTTKKSSLKKKRSQNKSKVYVMRGLANIFSLGMDDLAKKIRAKGIDAEVYNHARWNIIADAIVADKAAGNRGRVIIVGHSLGANALVKIANRVKAKKVKIDLMVAYDPTVKLKVPSNVKELVNYYKKSDAWGKKFVKAKGSKGRFKNIEMSKRAGTDHFNIDENNFLHRKTINLVVRTVGRYK